MQNAKYTATNYALRCPQKYDEIFVPQLLVSQIMCATCHIHILGIRLGARPSCAASVFSACCRGRQQTAGCHLLCIKLPKLLPHLAAALSVRVCVRVCVCVPVTILHFMSNAHAFNIDRRSSSREETDADATCSVWRAEEQGQRKGR